MNRSNERIMSFILFLLLLFLFFALFVVTSVLRLFGSIFRFGRNHRRDQVNQPTDADRAHQKVFSKDEGEYVDFEEIEEKEKEHPS